MNLPPEIICMVMDRYIEAIAADSNTVRPYLHEIKNYDKNQLRERVMPVLPTHVVDKIMRYYRDSVEPRRFMVELKTRLGI